MSTPGHKKRAREMLRKHGLASSGLLVNEITELTKKAENDAYEHALRIARGVSENWPPFNEGRSAINRVIEGIEKAKGT